MLEDLIDDQPAGAAYERPNEDSVLAMRHGADGRPGARSRADGLRRSFQRVVQPPIGALDVLVGAERFAEVHVLDQLMEGRGRAEHLSQHLRSQLVGSRGRLAGARLGWRLRQGQGTKQGEADKKNATEKRT